MDRRHGAAHEERRTARAAPIERGIVTIASRSLASRTPMATTMNAVATAMPAAARDRALVDAPVIRAIDVVEADRQPPDERA